MLKSENKHLWVVTQQLQEIGIRIKIEYKPVKEQITYQLSFL